MGKSTYLLHFLLVTTMLIGSACNSLLEEEIASAERSEATVLTPFALDSVNGQIVSEGSAIVPIDVNVQGGGDTANGAIHYDCIYDNIVDGFVSGYLLCEYIGVSFNSQTGEFSWTPGYSQAGDYEFAIIATDTAYSVREIFDITVLNVDTPPSLTSIAKQIVQSGKSVSFNISDVNGSDNADDGSTITYSCVYDTTQDGSVTSGTDCLDLYDDSATDDIDKSLITFDSSSGALSWKTPFASTLKQYDFKITANASNGLSDEVVIQVDVKANSAPALDSIADIVKYEQENVIFDAGDGADDLDQDGEALTYSCYYDSSGSGNYTENCKYLGVVFDSTTGEFNWIPTQEQAGVYDVRVVATDGVLTGSTDLKITILNTLLAIDNQVVAEGDTLTIDANATDALGDQYDPSDSSKVFNYSCTIDGTDCASYSGASFDTSKGELTFTPEYSETTYQSPSRDRAVIITADDGSTTFSKSFTLTIKNTDRIPTVTVSVPNIFWTHFYDDVVITVTDLDVGIGDDPDTFESLSCSILDDNGNFAADNSAVTYTNNSATPSGNTATCTIPVALIKKGTDVSFYYYAKTNNLLSLSTQHLYTGTLKESMELKFNIATDNETLELPFDGSYSIKVNWGDDTAVGSFSDSDASIPSHTYASSNADVSIYVRGDSTVATSPDRWADSWDFANFATSSASKITSVDNIGELGWIDLAGAFQNCTNLDSFSGAYTENVTTMQSMFEGASSLTDLDLSNMNTVAVTDMSRMFYGMVGLTSLNISNWNTDAVTDMSEMFSSSNTASSNALETLDLSDLDTAALTNMESMFENAAKLQTITFPTSFSCGTSSTSCSLAKMFKEMPKLTSLNLSSFNITYVNNMSEMFSGDVLLESLDLSNLNTSNVTNMSYMFYNTQGLLTLDVSSFNTSSATNLSYMFAKMSNVNEIKFPTTTITFGTNCDMSHMFEDLENLTGLDLSSFDTTNVTNMSYMFSGDVSLGSLDMSAFDATNVTDMSHMFENLKSLEDLDISSFNTTTSNVTDMSYMFSDASKATAIGGISTLDVSSVTTMEGMFQGMSELTELDLSVWDTSSVTNMNNMFNSATNLATLNANGWDLNSLTSGETGVSGIFENIASIAVTCDNKDDGSDNKGGTDTDGDATDDLFGQTCN